MARVLGVVSCLLPCLLAAQQAEPAPPEQPAFGGGWNSALGLGGGAGGLFGARGKPAPGATGVAIAAGLKWLYEHRNGEGHWTGVDPEDQVTNVSVTSLAMLAMLGDGSTLRSGPWRDAIKTGAIYLRGMQREDGAILPAGANDVLTHALATTAISEAFVLSNYKLLEGITGKALAWLEVQRRDDGCFPLAPGGRADAVATLWGRWARMTGEFGLLCQPGEDRKWIAAWLDSDDAGRLLERSLLTTPMAPGVDLELRLELDAAKLALGAFVRDRPREGDAGAITKVRDRRREWRQGVDLHEWLCASHLLQQAGTADDVAVVIAPLLAGQVRDGEHLGSWDPIDVCGASGGRSWSTAMAALTLLGGKRYAKPPR